MKLEFINGWRRVRVLSILILFLAGALSLADCRRLPPRQAVPASRPVELCGECLDLPTGEVCTAAGPLRNSCMAICTGERILCNSACPCPPDT